MVSDGGAYCVVLGGGLFVFHKDDSGYLYAEDRSICSHGTAGLTNCFRKLVA